jgi:CheY-like chemotaxis protein
MKKRLLFVDDEPAVLASLRTVFRRDCERWDMTFAHGGNAALAELEHEAFDVVVSDMRMPGIDGAQLLERVRERSPRTVRIILSGSVDTEDIARASLCVHELLAKPCSAAIIRDTINELLSARDIS